MAEKTSLNANEVASLLMVSPVAVCEWVQKGVLHAQLEGGGERSFSLDDIHQFAKQYRLKLSRADRSKMRILVVDADRQVTQFLVNLFSTLSETLQAQAAHSAFDAGRKMHTFRPDVVLLDLLMPNHEGFEICRRVKADPASHDVRIIAMNGFPSADYQQRIMMAGAEACLPKPLDSQLLFDTLGLGFERRPQADDLQ